MNNGLTGFWAVHSENDREGPGLESDVRWAIEVAGASGAVRVLDAACGPGPDTVVLADALPQAQIEAVDTKTHFVAEAQARVAQYQDRVEARVADMASVSGPYDLIWCAGALYFLGIADCLSGWRDALNDGGHVAFSHPCLTDAETGGGAAFWAGEGEIGNLASTRSEIEAAGYEVVDYRWIIGAGWARYYDGLEARIAQVDTTNADTSKAVHKTEREIALWRAAPDEVAYVLWVVRLK